MAQQTAVDWLVEQLRMQTPLYTKNEMIEIAKQMEREQKIGLLNWINEVSKVEPMRLETDHDDIVEQYYNETYGK